MNFKSEPAEAYSFVDPSKDNEKDDLQRRSSPQNDNYSFIPPINYSEHTPSNLPQQDYAYEVSTASLTLYVRSIPCA